MKTEKKIRIAFLLNLFFSILELIGGILTNSVAILSDSVHDFGDAVSIGLSYLLEKKSLKAPDDSHTYGYLRYSVLGGLITTLILISGSSVMIWEAAKRVISPVRVDSQGMILLAIIGVVLNFIAAYATHGGGSINQKAVNLHMLEDVLGWVIVLVGAIIMRVTDLRLLDPLMSIGVAIFILSHAIKNLLQISDLFLDKTPSDVDIPQLKKCLSEMEGIEDILLLQVRSIDGYHHRAALRAVTNAADLPDLKAKIREELSLYHITDAIIETEEERFGEAEPSLKG